MDELTAVRELRDRVEEPDAAARAATRQRLRAAMSGERRGGLRTALVPLTAGAVVLALIGGAAVVAGRGERTARIDSFAAEPTARTFLDAMARLAATRDDARPADRPVWYTKVNSSYMATTVVDENDPRQWRYLQQREDWYVPDGDGRILMAEGEPEFFREEDRAFWAEVEGRSAGWDTGRSGGLTFNLGEHQISLPELDALPTDDTALASRMAALGEKMGRADEVGHTQLVGQLLGGMPTRSAIRAALYRYLGTLPAKLLGEVRATDGATGVGIVVADATTEVRLVIDEATSRLLAWEIRTLVADPPIPAGAVVAYEAFHAQGWVATKTDRPAG